MLRQLVLAVAATLLFWGVVVPRACGDDEVIPAGQLCSPGHRYEPLRLVGPDGPRWWGLCYHGKDARAALARAGWADVEQTLDDSVEGRGPDVCMTCSDDILLDILIELQYQNYHRFNHFGRTR